MEKKELDQIEELQKISKAIYIALWVATAFLIVAITYQSGEIKEKQEQLIIECRGK
jgi:cell division protein FtsL